MRTSCRKDLSNEQSIERNNRLAFIYGYDPDNRLTNRTSAAKGTTRYLYDGVGNLTGVDYPINTNITLAYDVLNRQTNMVDAVGVTAYTYDAVGQLLSEGGLWPLDSVSYTYNNRLRTGLSLPAPNSVPWTESYGYDAAKRLTSLTSPAGTFDYAFDPAHHLKIRALDLPYGAHITNSYDSVARWLSTTLENSTNGVLNSHNYGYNSANQRTQQVFTATNYINYAYDNEGELVSAVGKESGGASRLQEQFGYAYDAAGNLNWRTNNALLQAFNVNTANELTTETNHGTLTVAGTTTSPATNVTVNGSTASLYADATFALAGLTLTNGSNTFTAVARDSYGRGATNALTVNLPGTNTFTYDANGNLLSDGLRNFAYDDENQLITVWVTNAWQSQFVYDAKMRRRIRREYTWLGSAWVETNEVHYIYDGNLVIQERNTNNLPAVTYTRGTDLSGSLQSAGGIGGLLARTDNSQLIARLSTAHAFYQSDANGNVTCLIYTDLQFAARYEYDPFGRIISQSGSLADANSYRFSSKEFHANSELVYYFRRFYDPGLQRWLNRDPVGELGFQSFIKSGSPLGSDQENLYVFVANEPISDKDAFGLCNINIACHSVLGLGIHCGVVAPNGIQFQYTTGNTNNHGGSSGSDSGGGPVDNIPPRPGDTFYPVSCDCQSCDQVQQCLRQAFKSTKPPPYNVFGPNSNTYAHSLLKACHCNVDPIPFTIERAPKQGGPIKTTTSIPPGAVGWGPSS